MKRREFLTNVVASTAALSMSKFSFPTILAAPVEPSAGPFTLSKLPYADNALAPFISSNTVGYHYGKHHAGYVKKLNDLVAGTPFAKKSLEEVMKETGGNAEKVGIYNASAQVWNHTFYWKSMHPKGGTEPKGKLKGMVESAYGDFKKFTDEFSNKATNLFGSGWCWLVLDGKKLSIVQTKDADSPIIHNQKPLLVVDVWEHAYYLDYQNRRKDYVDAFLSHLVHWDFAEENLGAAGI